MAKCTLNDLTPSLRCTTVVLSAVQELDASGGQTGAINFGKYQVEIFAELYDTVDEHGEGIADYLISQNVQNYVDAHITYSRDNSVKEFMDFLTSHQSGYREILGQSAEYGFNDAHKSMLFHDGVSACKHGSTLRTKLETTISIATDQFLSTINSLSHNSMAASNPFDPATKPSASDAWIYLHDSARSIVENFQLYLGDTQFMVTNTFIGRFMRHMVSMALSNFMYDSAKLGGMLAAHSLTIDDLVQKQDEDGNMYYTLPLQFVNQENDISVENCYIHTYCIYDLSKHLEDLGSTNFALPAEPGVESYMFSTVQEAAILSGKRPASPIVVDQRLQERIEEIIRSDYLSPYESGIDQLSLLTSEFDPRDSGIISRLYSSYELIPEGTSGEIYNTITKNYFFMNFGNFFKRKSKLSFMYNHMEDKNELDGFFQSNINNIVKDIHITRIRVDAEEEPKRILHGTTPVGTFFMGSVVDNGYMYTFEDSEFANLNDGEYIYQIDFSMQDLMFRFLRLCQLHIKLTLAKLDEAIEYIHNNPQHYDELRDSLSEQARLFLQNLFDAGNATSDFNKGVYAADMAMRNLGGYTLMETGAISLFKEIEANPELANLYQDHLDRIDAGEIIYENSADAMDFPLVNNFEDYFTPTTFADLETITRRGIENFRRILQDVITACSKFAGFSVSEQDKNYTSATYASGVTRTEFVNFSKTWRHDIVKAGMDYRMMCDMSEIAFAGAGTTGAMSANMLDSELRTEAEKHLGGISTVDWETGTTFRNMNHLTPFSVGRKIIDYRGTEDGEDVLNKIGLIEASVSNTYRKAGMLKDQITSRLYEQFAGDEVYRHTVEELKNDSGFFESLLGDLGTTITNESALSLDTSLGTLTAKAGSIFGIDFGENSPRNKFTLREIDAETSEEFEDERNAIRLALFQEAQKVEHLVMNCLVDPNGHHLLDRNVFTQGTKRTLNFISYDYHEIVRNIIDEGKPYPRLMNALLLSYYRNSTASTTDLSPVVILNSRFIADNTFLIFYLNGFDDNMNPVWTELLRRNVPDVLENAALQGENRVLCKLERFHASGELTNIGIGSSSELEITRKYFYLIAG